MTACMLVSVALNIVFGKIVFNYNIFVCVNAAINARSQLLLTPGAE